MDMPQASQPQAAAVEPIPADFLVRGGAVVIDALIVGITQTVLRIIMTAIHLPGALIRLVLFALGVAYFTYMIGACEGQTIGKKVAGVAVLGADGTPVSLARACGRYFATLLSGFLLGIGYLVALFTDKRRALHDLIAGTRVIYAVEITQTRKIVMSILGLLIPFLAILAVVAAVAVPSFLRMSERAQLGGGSPVAAPANLPELVQRSKDVSNRASLGILRDLNTAYQAKNGAYSRDLRGLFPTDVLKDVPLLQLSQHGETNQVQAYGAEACAESGINPAGIKDTGKWGYVSDKSAPCAGKVFIDCTHPDSAGKAWANY